MDRARRSLCLLAAAFSLSAAVAVRAGTAPEPVASNLRCGLVSQPAATVLLPYFEVDVDNPAGRNTLFSVGTVSPASTLAHVVVWSNWSQAVLSFDVVIPAEGLRTFDLRGLLRGRLPRTSPPPDATTGTDTAPLTCSSSARS